MTEEARIMVMAKRRLVDLIRAASDEAVFYAPVRSAGGTRLEAVRAEAGGALRCASACGAGEPSPSPAEIAFDYINFRAPVKSTFFPQSEAILSFDRSGCAACLASASGGSAEGSVVLFGVRPCDARGLALLDRIFGAQMGGRDDPYYMHRRERTLVITLACDRAGPSCFCGSVGGGPRDRSGSDIMAFDLGDELAFESCTDRGAGFLDRYSEALGGGTPRRTARELATEAKPFAAASELIEPMEGEAWKGFARRLDGNFDNPLWDRLSATCLGCGACVYQCPTCHCFDITDEGGDGRGVRVRTWDSCQYPLFTRHASGHNPRENRRQRVRQRMMHKFSYTLANVGEIFCVGCGRCIQACPVNIDIREALAALMKLPASG